MLVWFAKRGVFDGLKSIALMANQSDRTTFVRMNSFIDNEVVCKFASKRPWLFVQLYWQSFCSYETNTRRDDFVEQERAQDVCESRTFVQQSIGISIANSLRL